MPAKGKSVVAKGSDAKAATTERGTLALPDPKLLALLVCPATKEPLVLDKKKAELISVAAGVAYPIRDGIPIMLEDEARPLTTEEKAAYKKSAS